MPAQVVFAYHVRMCALRMYIYGGVVWRSLKKWKIKCFRLKVYTNNRIHFPERNEYKMCIILTYFMTFI